MKGKMISTQETLPKSYFDGKPYKQIVVAMVSPLGPNLANIFQCY